MVPREQTGRKRGARALEERERERERAAREGELHFFLFFPPTRILASVGDCSPKGEPLVSE